MQASYSRNCDQIYFRRSLQQLRSRECCEMQRNYRRKREGCCVFKPNEIDDDSYRRALSLRHQRRSGLNPKECRDDGVLCSSYFPCRAHSTSRRMAGATTRQSRRFETHRGRSVQRNFSPDCGSSSGEMRCSFESWRTIGRGGRNGPRRSRTGSYYLRRSGRDSKGQLDPVHRCGAIGCSIA